MKSRQSIPAEDSDNLREDIESEMFELEELSAIYQVSQDVIIATAKEMGCSAVLIDGAIDEYLYL